MLGQAVFDSGKLDSSEILYPSLSRSLRQRVTGRVTHWQGFTQGHSSTGGGRFRAESPLSNRHNASVAVTVMAPLRIRARGSEPARHSASDAANAGPANPATARRRRRPGQWPGHTASQGQPEHRHSVPHVTSIGMPCRALALARCRADCASHQPKAGRHRDCDGALAACCPMADSAESDTLRLGAWASSLSSSVPAASPGRGR